MKMPVPLPNNAITLGVPLVSSLEVALSEDQTTLLVGFQGTKSTEPATWALSPPAAARLARELRKHVKEHLYGAPDETVER